MKEVDNVVFRQQAPKAVPTSGNKLVRINTSGRLVVVSADGTEAQVPTAAATVVTGGSGSAGSGKQYVALTVGGVTYKVLHDGTV